MRALKSSPAFAAEAQRYAEPILRATIETYAFSRESEPPHYEELKGFGLSTPTGREAALSHEKFERDNWLTYSTH